MTAASPAMVAYFRQLDARAKECYEIAKKARSLGFDPEFEPEIPQAGDLAERVEKLVGPKGVSDVIRKLEKEMGREELAFKVAEMVMDGTFGRLEDKQAAEQAVRTALAIITEGTATAAPLEGITQLEIKKNLDGSNCLAIYFASPIRAAGGTAAALAVLLADFVRRKLYLNVYKPTDLEVERFVEEVALYKTEVSPGQYSPPTEDIRKAVRNIPVEITGEPTEDVEVTGYRDIERVETNRVRGGAVLALCEGVMQKASKILKHVTSLNIDGWSWLSDLTTQARPTEAADKYLDEVIAGRPVFGYPGREGGFRLRYGHARNTGIAAIGVHPATMVMCDDFIAVGTQLKLERPGKGGAVTPVDTIDGPVVKLRNGSVVQVDSVEQALELRDKVEEILFLGDILIGYGEFLENNQPLVPAGYCQEWWAQEVIKAHAGKSIDEDLTPYLTQPYQRPSPQLAIEISKKLGVPLHPAYTYHFQDIGADELKTIATWLLKGEPKFEGGTLTSLRVPIEQSPKRILEVLGVPHRVEDNSVVIEEHAFPLCTCLGILDDQRLSGENLDATIRANPTKDPIDLVQVLAGVTVRAKAPTRIGCRMGRPEKANPRIMSPPVHVLFPVGLAGGATRNVIKAAEKGALKVQVVRCECPECGTVSFTRKCPKCGAQTDFTRVCPRCGRPMSAERCGTCNVRTEFFSEREIDVKSLWDSALVRLQEPALDRVKGVEGMTSEFKVPEPLEKGILRAKHDVYVFKDGTVRFDATDVPLTHFRPREMETSVEKLHEFGYTSDYNGEPLESDDQIVELKVQDIILSRAGAEYLLNASKFVDELLQKFYGLPPYYNANGVGDLVGQLVIGLAPHTSVGTVGRIIGFSSANVGYAHPYFHAAKRRDCDGDEDAVMLLLDALLNFSKRFLPSKRGGRMDAPLILNTKLNPAEVDEEAHNMDVMEAYPLEFYEATLLRKNPAELLLMMKTVKGRLGKEEQYEGLKFTHDSSDISSGPHSSLYKTLETMEEKTSAQLGLARKIRAVEANDVAERLIKHHFIRDLKGNMRAFATQQVRCTKCNAKYRRVPLSGVCYRCGGNIILTVTRGGVEKYLDVAMQIAQQYHASDYTKQRLKLMQRDIMSVFESDAHRQLSLADFM